ncbi:MAG: hypothetical protein IPK35_11010 [Saprospiraceae bacterium]|nr:hypothetical protein [Saprospiraceae bacterium]
MMVELHIDEKVLKQKIEVLMEYRLFPLLFDESTLPKEEKRKFYDRLIDLQSAIYLLDAHLEANWEVDEQVLQSHWSNITDKLCQLGIKQENAGAYLSHIKKYEKHELELRKGKSPLRFDLEYFYFYKSCDVKLLRRLIFEKMHLEKTCGALADWRYYDLITEVNDDVEDLIEDLQFINGNRFLISLLKSGKEKTYEEYAAFMNQIIVKAETKLDHSHYKLKNVIFEGTNQQVIETLKLMIQTIENVDEKLLDQSKLFSHLQEQKV